MYKATPIGILLWWVWFIILLNVIEFLIWFLFQNTEHWTVLTAALRNNSDGHFGFSLRCNIEYESMLFVYNKHRLGMKLEL